MKRLLIAAVILLLLGGLGAGGWFYLKSDKKSPEQQAQESNSPPPPTHMRLIATGDMVPHDAINKAAKQADDSYSYLPFMINMKPIFDKADVRFCNQATPAGGAEFGVTGFPLFNAPSEFIQDLSRLGCNVVNTASNHANDKGQKVIDAMLNTWQQQPGVLAVAGTNRSAEEQNQIRYFTSKGIKFALLAYTSYNNTSNGTAHGVNMYKKEVAQQQLAAANAEADIAIVSMRWGDEYSPKITAFQNDTAQFLADNGADIILGHGQHVLGPVKKLQTTSGQETLVWYGLGNFLNAQLPPETLFNGIAVMDIELATKKVSTISYLPVYMHYEWTAEEAKREDLLARKNFIMYTLDTAAEPLSRSQNKTTIEAQLERITTVLNQFTTVKILHDNEY